MSDHCPDPDCHITTQHCHVTGTTTPCYCTEHYRCCSCHDDSIQAPPERVIGVLVPESRLLAAEARAAAAEAQLPEGMKHCTIVFRECSLGHGWLTATNWAQHGCPTCARNEQRGRAEAWKNTVNELAGQKTHLLARAAALQAEVARLRAAIEAAASRRCHIQVDGPCSVWWPENRERWCARCLCADALAGGGK